MAVSKNVFCFESLLFLSSGYDEQSRNGANRGTSPASTSFAKFVFAV